MIFILSRRLITTCCSHTMSEQKQNVPSSCCGITIPYQKGLLMLDMLLHLGTIGKKVEKSYPWLSSVERVKFQVRLANIHKFSDFYIQHVKCLHKPLDKNYGIQFCLSGTTEHFKARINLAQLLDNTFTQPGLEFFYRFPYELRSKALTGFRSEYKMLFYIFLAKYVQHKHKVGHLH